MQQVADCIWMVRPAAFYANAETAHTNAFQHSAQGDFTQVAQAEFDNAVSVLRSHSVNLIVTESADKEAPDALFPNNWISFHAEGKVVLYPMLALNRRRERLQGIPEIFMEKNEIAEVLDLSDAEADGEFLEGTGSIVFDHARKTAYACRSQRTNEDLFNDLCDYLEYSSVVFDARDVNGDPVYHTNVMMSIGANEIVICLEAIAEDERETLRDNLLQSGRKLVEISLLQMEQFAGNMLQVMNKEKERLWIMSTSAGKSLNDHQKKILTENASLLLIDIPVIERIGGGSIRCMMAEVFLPAKK